MMIDGLERRFYDFVGFPKIAGFSKYSNFI